MTSRSEATARDLPLKGQVALGYTAPGSCSGDHEVYIWPADQQEAQFGLEVAVTGLRDALRRGNAVASHRWLRSAERALQQLSMALPACPGGCKDGVVRSGIHEVQGVLRADERPCPVCAPFQATPVDRLGLCAGMSEEGL